MKEIITQNVSRLEYFKELYHTALTANAAYEQECERSLGQYLGSDEIDGSDKRARTVRNITYEIIESEISADVPVPKVDSACYSERRERNARSIERLCTAIRERLPFEAMNDKDERYTYIMGGSVWYVEWDSSSREDAVTGGVRVHCICPTDFIPQPGILDIDSMEYCFLRFTTTKGELITKYGVKKGNLELAECEYEYGGDGFSDTVKVIVCFYRSQTGEVGKLVFSGDLLLSDIPDYYRRKVRVCRPKCGKDGEKEYVWCDQSTEKIPTEVLMPGECGELEIPYYTPRRFPIIIRQNTQGFPSLFGGSDCERIRAQQQAINKIETRILEKLLRAGITPVMPEGSTVSLGNAVFGQVIRMRPGESLDSYGKIDTTPDISQDIEEAERLYDHAKRVLGISDALQGTETPNAESGYARQLKINQASSRLETKRRMKYLAYSEIYRLIFEHYLAFADEPRSLSYKDSFGRIHLAEFNRYDFLERAEDGSYRYDDGYLFSVDLNGGNEYTREALWAKNLANLEAGTLGDKSDPMTLLRYWQSQERAHYPYARENVEFFKGVLERDKEKNEKQKEETNENLQ